MPDMPEPEPEAQSGAFFDLLARWRAEPSIGTDDLIAATRPLLDQVRLQHEQGNVAPLDGVDRLRLSDGRELWFHAADGRPAEADPAVLAAIDRPASDVIDVTGEVRVLESGGTVRVNDLGIAPRGSTPERPLHYLDYTTWEMAVGQHDALADIHALGMILASLASRLDFTQRDELQRFLAARRNVLPLNPRIHPVVARLITHMTEPSRAARAQDLDAIIATLDDYLRADTDDFEERLGALEQLAEPEARRRQTQDYLRNRLFEVSRRNRLVYFKDGTGSANLTLGSLPFTLDYKAVKPGQLLLLNNKLVSTLARHHADESWMPLQQHLRFADYPFLSPTLDKIRLQARSDTKEYGFSQLRLVLAYLRWTNLARARDERIHSPLILLPVDMRRQQGTDNGYDLLPLVSPREAEVNPVLRHHLRDLYGVELPETIDLTRAESLPAMVAELSRDIGRRQAGVSIAMVTRPRIQLIHRTVQRQVEDFNRRRRRTGHGLKNYAGLTYSYDPDNRAPLGLALFNQRVRTAPAPGREMIGQASAREATTAGSGGGQRETSREFYALDTGEHTDPLAWEIDLTQVTLANFNYRKMSLVRDYAELKAGRTYSHVNFERLFSSGIKPALPELARTAYAERYFVLPSDPSQDQAVLAARLGESYVIQGPPGTGKSQTIANLLADFAARGKKVLFVCEKRVALDVVFHRLSEAGLDDLTCLIHDSRDDKKGVVAELKRLYEGWRQAPGRSVAERRQKLVAEINRIIAELEAFSAAMTSPPNGENTPLRAMIGLAVARHVDRPWLDATKRERLPRWAHLDAARPAIAEIERIGGMLLGGTRPQDVLRFVRPELGHHPRLIAHLAETVPAARQALESIQRLGAASQGRAPAKPLTLEALASEIRFAAALRPLARSGSLSVLDRYGAERGRLDDTLQRLQRRAAELDAAEASQSGWTERLSPAETEVALAIARQREGSLLSVFYSDWRRLKRRIRDCHPAPVLSIVALLEQLAAQHAARAGHAQDARSAAESFGHDDLATLRAQLDVADALASDPASTERALVAYAIAEPEAARRAILALADGSPSLDVARERLDRLLEGYASEPLPALTDRLGLLAARSEAVAELLPRLAALESVSPELASAWREVGLPLADLERATLAEAMARAFRSAPTVQAFRSTDLQDLASRLEAALAELRTLNSRHIIAECRSRFRQSLAAAQSTAKSAGPNPRGEIYREGCRVLEHQFGLTRPSKSLRELLTGEAGAVLRDLKPIWMMSPLSVADTLPFADDLFDAVIFDEASQIPLEDAIPSLYRARQTIIVGDEMQLPPTSFFASANEGDEPLPDYLAYAVSADSLLTKAAGTLASTRLAWHYRSRHESLISFCNRAFYGGNLNTVPSVRPLATAPPIVIEDSDQALPAEAKLAASILERAISAHRIADGVYLNQQNADEARYIAALVRALLKRKAGRSIGVVAFSEPQAEAITAAIDQLAAEDKRFGDLLEEERERHVDGQFTGLFVKNLESVQGDERDIVIVSVGYAPGPDGRMRMNFGPINQAGGEKRLNVIFSRARHHVAIVSSIGPESITNDYNVGANTLKQYLRYAAAVSVGNETEISNCLDSLGAGRSERGWNEGADDPVVQRIADEFAGSGHDIELNVGHSTLTVDVAARRAETPGRARAILVDTDRHYAIDDVVERYVTRPAVFRAFGWDVEHRLAKDQVLVAVQDQAAAGTSPTGTPTPTAGPPEPTSPLTASALPDAAAESK